jgi:hypothetical protein
LDVFIDEDDSFVDGLCGDDLAFMGVVGVVLNDLLLV